jgi:hypothetical protein
MLLTSKSVGAGQLGVVVKVITLLHKSGLQAGLTLTLYSVSAVRPCRV